MSKMRNLQENQLYKNRYVWLAFLVAFLPRLLFLANTHTLSISGDEIFSMWPAAKLAGYPWEQVMSGYRYYGYGYTILLYPFIAWIHDPVILYRCLVFLMILAQSLTAPICYHLMKEYLNVKQEKTLCLSAIACSYLVTVRAVYTYPEFIYDLVFWLSVWGLLKLEKSRGKKQKAGYTLLCMLILTYALSVHSRGAAVWMAFVGTVIFYAWVYRKSLVSLLTCAAAGIAGFVLGNKGIGAVLSYLGYESAANVSNTSAGVSMGIFDYLRDPRSWTTWVNIIIGQLNEAVINTGGLAVGIVVVLLVLLWKALIRKKEILEATEVSYAPYIVVGVYCILAVVITIAGQSLTWLPGVLNAADGGNPDSFRAFTYFRYYGAYTGPILMLGIAFFVNKPELLNWVKGKTLLIAGMLQGYWVLCILPLVCYFNGCVWSYAPFSLTKGFVDEIGLRSYLPGTIVVAAVLIFSYYLCTKKKQRIVLWILCAFLMYSYGYNALYHEGYRGNLNYTYMKSGRELLTTLEENGILLEQIYVEGVGVPNSGQSLPCLYQFSFQDISVAETAPEKAEENAVFMCFYPDEYDDLLECGYELGQISDHEYVYVSDEKIRNEMEKAGVDFVTAEMAK